MPRNDFVNIDGTINYDNITSKPDFRNSQGFISVLAPPSPLVAVKGNDGTTDETTAIQAILDYAKTVKASVFFPSTGYSYRFTSLNWPLGVSIEGPLCSSQSTTGVMLQGLDNTKNLLVIPSGLASGYVPMSAALKYITLSGGYNQIYAPDGAVDLNLENVRFVAPSNAGFWSQGFLQELWWKNIDFSGGNYGFYHEDLVGLNNSSSNSLIDKCVFDTTYAHGQTINGWYVKTSNGSANTWIHPQIVNIGQHGFVTKAGQNWTMINLNTEIAAGYVAGGVGANYETTGSITSGTNSLTVVSTTGFQIGQTITVFTAGGGTSDLVTTITNIVGSVFTLLDNAGTTVVSVPVTNAIYNVIENTAGCPITFINGSIVQGYDNMFAKYAVNGGNCNFIGSSIFRVADYGGSSTIVGGQVGVVRTIGNNESFSASSIPSGGVNARTNVVTGPGQDLLLGLVDSNKNGSGTLGNLVVKKFDANRTQLLLLNSANGSLTLRGGISPGTVDALGNNSNGYQRMFVGAGVPTGGTWRAGDMIFNNAPVASGVWGWMCVTSGTPGTWKTMGTLSA